MLPAHACCAAATLPGAVAGQAQTSCPKQAWPCPLFSPHCAMHNNRQLAPIRATTTACADPSVDVQVVTQSPLQPCTSCKQFSRMRRPCVLTILHVFRRTPFMYVQKHGIGCCPGAGPCSPSLLPKHMRMVNCMWSNTDMTRMSQNGIQARNAIWLTLQASHALQSCIGNVPSQLCTRLIFSSPCPFLPKIAVLLTFDQAQQNERESSQA